MATQPRFPLVNASAAAVPFEHAIVRTDEGTECTIFPRGCEDGDIVTCWVTAKDGAYVSLEDVR